MPRNLNIDDIYDPDKKIDFDGAPQPDVIWIDEGQFIVRKTDPTTKWTEWLKVSALTGDSAPLFDVNCMRTALLEIPGISAEDATRLAHLPSFVMDPKKTAVVLNQANSLIFYLFRSNRAFPLTTAASLIVGEEFSPDGKMVSFVCGNNLHVVEVETQRSWALTSDGNPQTFNGRLDWVYQEEIYGRDNFKGYWWSPDSTCIAYLRLDESSLKEYPVTDHIPFHPEVEVTNYPLAGDPNPKVRLGVVDPRGGTTRWIDISRYESTEFLIVRVGWTPDSARVAYQVQDREQRWLELNVDGTMLFREQRETWVGVSDEAKWLKDGSFLWLSERSGWRHIDRHAADGTFLHPVTEGNWEVRTLLGLDEPNGLVYFSATKDGPLSEQTYRVRANGSGLERLTSANGTHRSIFSPKCSGFVDYRSEVNTPPQVRLHSADGRELRVLVENKVEVLSRFDLGRVEFLQIPARDGFLMEALLILPPDFDASRRYPVMSYTYSGPHHPTVLDAWGGEKYLWHQMLAQMGYVVWICDNRTASGKGAQSTWPMYRNAGESELRDLEDGIAWLKSQPYIDGERIGLWGWSYGGFMTAYALTHSSTFKIGIVGAPVTDWHNYDSIYTERYMATPQNNPEGYEKSSVVKAAANLNGRMLLVHGSTDDNVHVQNSIQFAYELQKAGKQFEWMIYPRTRHLVLDPLLLKHLRTLMTDFIVKYL